MKKLLSLLFLLSLLSLSPCHAAKDAFPHVRELMLRRVPWLASHVTLREQKGGEKSTFTLQTTDGRLVVTATDASAAAVGVNWYLKYYCHRQMSHMGDNLAPLSPLPVVTQAETHSSDALLRYALNYCTFNYTMSFYSWSDWEHELDWMALHGVNIMLMAMGQEAVWSEVLSRLGYDEDEIRAFLPGPAYTAWWLMGNLEGEGGPMPRSQVESRKALARDILARMKELAIEPVMPGFYGMVPGTLKNKLQAHILPQGKWCGFTRPDILDPTDKEFARIAGLYYAIVKKFYGNGIRYFSGDPFHEGGNTGGIDMAQAGQAIQAAMQRAYPKSTWVLQGWQGNPRAEMLRALDKRYVLVQELFGENTADWEKRGGYEGTPFIWGVVNNFGERPGMNGKLQRFVDEWNRVKNSPYAHCLRGIGILPEGLRNNPAAYELALELPWHEEKPDLELWIKQYALARYGQTNARIDSAWTEMLHTCYASGDFHLQGPGENIVCARPSLDITRVSSWGSTKKPYDMRRFAFGCFKLLDPGKDFNTESETYRIDKTMMELQILGNTGDAKFENLKKAIMEKDPELFHISSIRFHALSTQMDLKASKTPFFRMETWIKQALDAGNTPEEKRNNLHNLLSLVTYWGGQAESNDVLHEYSYREWSGLLKDFYTERWKLYFKNFEHQMRGDGPAPVDYRKWEHEWVERQMSKYLPQQ